ncbi:hypothetical protein CYMTET_43197, partial [Cymbomonas tetramitiformis]
GNPTVAPPCDSVEGLCSVGDIFSPNEIEAFSIVGPGSPVDVVERIAEAGAKVVILRRGQQGSVVYDSQTGEMWEVRGNRWQEIVIKSPSRAGLQSGGCHWLWQRLQWGFSGSMGTRRRRVDCGRVGECRGKLYACITGCSITSSFGYVGAGSFKSNPCAEKIPPHQITLRLERSVAASSPAILCNRSSCRRIRNKPHILFESHWEVLNSALGKGERSTLLL